MIVSGKQLDTCIEINFYFYFFSFVNLYMVDAWCGGGGKRGNEPNLQCCVYRIVKRKSLFSRACSFEIISIS